MGPEDSWWKNILGRGNRQYQVFEVNLRLACSRKEKQIREAEAGVRGHRRQGPRCTERAEQGLVGCSGEFGSSF